MRRGVGRLVPKRAQRQLGVQLLRVRLVRHAFRWARGHEAQLKRRHRYKGHRGYQDGEGGEGWWESQQELHQDDWRLSAAGCHGKQGDVEPKKGEVALLKWGTVPAHHNHLTPRGKLQSGLVWRPKLGLPTRVRLPCFGLLQRKGSQAPRCWEGGWAHQAGAEFLRGEPLHHVLLPRGGSGALLAGLSTVARAGVFKRHVLSPVKKVGARGGTRKERFAYAKESVTFLLYFYQPLIL